MQDKSLGAFGYLENAKGEVLLVKQNYGEFYWTLPGGSVEVKEDPRAAAVREVLEETGIEAEVKEYIGTYAAPYRNDIVILFAMSARSFALQGANHEISDLRFFPKTALPPQLSQNTRVRLTDGMQKRRGVFRVFVKPGVLG